jgi:hypothetical protein
MEKNYLEKLNLKNKNLMAKFKFFFKRSIAGRDFFQSKIVRSLLILALVANIADWTILSIYIRPVDTAIILHYNVYFGVDMMGSWRIVYLMPIIGLILFIANALLAAYFYRNKERIASYVLLMAAFMIQMSFIIASISIIIINY